jgi:hypothetical protein
MTLVSVQYIYISIDKYVNCIGRDMTLASMQYISEDPVRGLYNSSRRNEESFSEEGVEKMLASLRFRV